MWKEIGDEDYKKILQKSRINIFRPIIWFLIVQFFGFLRFKLGIASRFSNYSTYPSYSWHEYFHVLHRSIAFGVIVSMIVFAYYYFLFDNKKPKYLQCLKCGNSIKNSNNTICKCGSEMLDQRKIKWIEKG